MSGDLKFQETGRCWVSIFIGSNTFPFRLINKFCVLDAQSANSKLFGWNFVSFIAIVDRQIISKPGETRFSRRFNWNYKLLVRGVIRIYCNIPCTVNLNSSLILVSWLINPCMNFGGWFFCNNSILSVSFNWFWISSNVKTAELVAKILNDI